MGSTAAAGEVVQVVAVTMDADGLDVLSRMGVVGSAVLGNQTTFEAVWKGQSSRGDGWVGVCEKTRGVGKNRNAALRAATGDIVLLADDDMRFVPGYEEIAARAYNEYPQADVIVFNLGGSVGGRRMVSKVTRVRWFNYQRIGGARLSFRLSKVRGEGLEFSTLFGAGARYSAGEDTLFLRDCLSARLRVICVPVSVADLVDLRESTWFRGYNLDFFHSRGALFAAVSRISWRLLVLQFLVRHWRGLGGVVTFNAALRAMFDGGNEYLALSGKG